MTPKKCCTVQIHEYLIFVSGIVCIPTNIVPYHPGKWLKPPCYSHVRLRVHRWPAATHWKSLANVLGTRPRLPWPRHRRSCSPALCRISTAGRRWQRNWRCTRPAVRYPMSLSATCRSRPRLSQTNRVRSDDVWMTSSGRRVEQPFWNRRFDPRSVWRRHR